MDVFDVCRICLSEINHEPIKMTRLILKFLEKCLQLTNLAMPNPQGNVKQNLCAPCFNKISEFQEFFEQCKDSDVFWKARFDDLKEIALGSQLSLVDTVFFPLVENGTSTEADTTVSTTELKQITYSCRENILSPKLEMGQKLQASQENEKTLLATSSQTIKEEKAAAQIESVNSIDLTNWTGDADDDDSEIKITEYNECDDIIKNPNEEIIEYEYKIDYEQVESVPTNDESATDTDTSGVDYRSYSYEKLEIEASNQSTIIRETTKETQERSENTENFFLSTTSDENGKVKTSYKCLHCDKVFSRIYDIESHCNIHSGIKPFTCNVCGKSFRQKNILTTHQALHFGKKVECAECGKKFARRSQLTLHYRMHRDEKPFVCNIGECQAAFRQKKQLIDHSYIHTDEKNFQCATCAKSFHTRKRLQDHIYKVHSHHRYRCELCEKAFLKPHMLKHHMITAHNVEIDDVSHLKTSVEVLKPTKKLSK